MRGVSSGTLGHSEFHLGRDETRPVGSEDGVTHVGSTVTGAGLSGVEVGVNRVEWGRKTRGYRGRRGRTWAPGVSRTEVGGRDTKGVDLGEGTDG